MLPELLIHMMYLMYTCPLPLVCLPNVLLACRNQPHRHASGGDLLASRLQVGNAFTFATNEIGSLTKIQADSSSCGGSTSSGLGDVLGWTSTVTGPVQVCSRDLKCSSISVVLL